MLKTKKRTQTKVVVLPKGTAANSTIDTEVQLDKSFDACTGIAIQVINDGEVEDGFFRVGFKDDNKTYEDLTHVNNLTAGAAVAPNDKYKAVDIPISDGQLVSIVSNIPSTLSGELKYEVAFLLERYEVIEE